MQVEPGKLKQSDLKEQAIKFYAEHDVTGVLEKLLNTMFLDSPGDLYGYMSEYFHTLSKEVMISNIEGGELLDSNGDPSLSLTLYCIVNGIKKALCTYTHTVNHQENKIAQTKGTDEVDQGTEPHDNRLSPLDSLSKINDLLNNAYLKDQLEINRRIMTEEDVFHPSTQAAVSRVAALSLAKISNKPLFLSLSNTFSRDDHSKVTLSVPLPLTAVMTSGTGKLKVRGLYLAPSSTTVSVAEGINHVLNLYRELGRALATKQGPAATSVNGAYYMTSDKLEVAMDLLRDTGVAIGVQLNKEVMAVLDIGGEAMYDEDKKKYEFATGQWKTGEELVNIFSNLASTYPGLIGFIDPFHPKDISSWQLLENQLGEDCMLMADKALLDLPLKEPVSPPDPNEETSATLSHIGCAALSFSCTQSLCKCFDEAVRLRGLSTYLMFSTQNFYTSDTLGFDVHLAVALQCRFIRVHAPVGVTSTNVLSELLQVQGQLESLQLQGPSSFSCESEC